MPLKIPRVETSAPTMAPSPLSLPLPVLSHILEFAVNGFATEVVVPHAPYLSPYHLQCIASVSKQSLQSVEALAEQFRGSSLMLGSDGSMTAEDIPPMYQLVESKGAAVRCLSVRLGRKESGYDPQPGALDDSDIDWDKIFRHLPTLKRLDLTKLSLVSRHVPEILEAASKNCCSLEALILPSRGFVHESHYEYTNAVYGAPIEKLMTTLYQALERWHNGKTGAGLRQLTVPTRNEVERRRSTTEFLEAVMKFCPQIEYLDGYEKMKVHGDAQCYDMWAITLKTWEKFNKTCTSLKKFSWAVVPFADPFFQVFGDHVKPNLTELSLSANQCWNYHRYFRECEGQIVAPPPNDDEEDVEASRPGYGLLALEITAVLRACPTLTKLSIAIDYRRNGRSRYVNTSLYGDAFWEAVADHCPHLETITMSDCSGYANYSVKSIDTLTDRTLLSLARMKSLRSLELAPARLTGKGIFEYLRISKDQEFLKNDLTIQIRVSGHERTLQATPRFYDEIVELLKLLAETSEEDLGAAACRRKPEIYIGNPYKSKVDRSWCEPYMRDRLMPVLEAVQERHPSLALQVWLCGHNGDIFNRIDFVKLKWNPKDEFDRQLFKNTPADDEDDEIYRIASMNETISLGSGDEGEGGQVTVHNLHSLRDIMAEGLGGEGRYF